MDQGVWAIYHARTHVKFLHGNVKSITCAREVIVCARQVINTNVKDITCSRENLSRAHVITSRAHVKGFHIFYHVPLGVP